MGAQGGFLELEVTYSRLGGKDLNQLYSEIRTMIVRIFGLNAFFHLMEQEASINSSSDMQGPVSLHDTHTVSVYDCEDIDKADGDFVDPTVSTESKQSRDRQ